MNSLRKSAAFLAAVFVMTMTTMAHAGGMAFVWGNEPMSARYRPADLYAFNLNGATTISRSGIGKYQVDFAGLTMENGFGGHVQISAYGSTDRSCQVENWFPSAGGLRVSVLCFDRNGVAGDAYFTALAMMPSSVNNPMAYVWANDAVRASYVPAPQYSFNEGGNTIAITRSGTGVYQVRFKGLPVKMYKGGNVQISPYGAAPRLCMVQNWGASGTDLLVNVRCTALNGSPADAQFTALVSWQSYYPFWLSYAWGSQLSAPSYEASSTYSSVGTNIKRLSAGSYLVQFPKTSTSQPDNYQTSVQVTSYGPNAGHCVVEHWRRATPRNYNDTMDVYINCRGVQGEAKDSLFTVLALYPLQIT